MDAAGISFRAALWGESKDSYSNICKITPVSDSLNTNYAAASQIKHFAYGLYKETEVPQVVGLQVLHPQMLSVNYNNLALYQL